MDDLCLANVLKHINTGRDYKAVCLVCKDWFRIIRVIHNKGKKFTNHIITLVKLFPNWKWNYTNLTDKMCFGYMELSPKKWNWKLLAMNSRLTYGYVKAHPEYPWDYKAMCGNQNISWDGIMELCYGRYQYGRLSGRKDIDWDYVADNLDIKWNWHKLSNGVPPDVLIDNMDWNWHWHIVAARMPVHILKLLPEKGWHYTQTYDNPDIMNIVRLYPNLNWNWQQISFKRIVDLDFIKEFPILLEHAKNLSWNPNVMEFIKEFPDADWDWRYILSDMKSLKATNEYAEIHGMRPIRCITKHTPFSDVCTYTNIHWVPLSSIARVINKLQYRFTMREIYDAEILGISGLYRKYPDLDWDYKQMSWCKLDFNIVLENLNKPWDWSVLTTMTHYKIIFTNPTLPWEWEEFSKNLTLNWRVIAKKPEFEWNLRYLQLSNRFHQ